MGILHTRFQIETGDGNVLYCDERVAEGTDRRPVIVVAHGFKGFKDWGFFPWTCEELARRGYYVLNFNFSHNGVHGDSEEFTELDRFAENTFSREVAELRRMIDAVVNGEIPHPERADSEVMMSLGHSRGGGVVLIEAASDPRIKGVATWASVATFIRYTEAQKERWRRDGYLDVPNTRTGQIMRLNVTLLDDIEGNARELNVEAAAAALHRPLLILHGAVDLSVEPEAADRLYAAADRATTEREIIPRTGHTFGVAHPFEGPSDVLRHIVDRTDTFFRERVIDRRTVERSPAA